MNRENSLSSAFQEVRTSFSLSLLLTYCLLALISDDVFSLTHSHHPSINKLKLASYLLMVQAVLIAGHTAFNYSWVGENIIPFLDDWASEWKILQGCTVNHPASSVFANSVHRILALYSHVRPSVRMSPSVTFFILFLIQTLSSHNLSHSTQYTEHWTGSSRGPFSHNLV